MSQSCHGRRSSSCTFDQSWIYRFTDNDAQVQIDIGPVSAWCDAHIDCLIMFKPFHYTIEVGISVGVKFELDAWLVHIRVSASGTSGLPILRSLPAADYFSQSVRISAFQGHHSAARLTLTSISLASRSTLEQAPTLQSRLPTTSSWRWCSDQAPIPASQRLPLPDLFKTPTAMKQRR